MATGGQIIYSEENCTCSICLEKLKSPKRLPCLHTFCDLCIQEFLSATEPSVDFNPSDYLCPICRAVLFVIKPEIPLSRWVSLLPDIQIGSTMEKSEKKDNENECNTCSRQNIRSEAKFWCQDCRDSFCDQCIKLHKVMKFSADHTVVQISQISMDKHDLDLSIISDSCPVHKSKRVEAYCVDHKQILCVLCLTLQHRKCDNVQEREIPSVNKDALEEFQKDLTIKENDTDKLLQESKRDKEKLMESFVEIETTAAQHVQSMKDKLDELLVSFKKELALKQDENKLKQQQKIESLSTLLENLQSINSATNLVNCYGSSVQIFVHLEKSKSEIELKMREAITQLKVTSNVEVQFIVDEILRQINQRDCIGRISITESINKPLIGLRSLDSCIDIRLSKKRTMYLNGYKITGGVCISTESLVLCTAPCKLVKLNLDDGTVIQEYKVCHNPKRVSFNPKNTSFLVSCYDNCLLRVLYDTIFRSYKAIKGKPPPNGGVCTYAGNCYAIVGSELQKLSDSSSKLLTSCFKTDTDCSGLNALAVDPKGKRFMYTTKDFHIRCISVDGEEMFSYNKNKLQKINSLAVSARGLTYEGDESGSIHVISENGEKMKTLLSKCGNIKNLSDIWLDKSGNTLYVCGDEYIELCMISFNLQSFYLHGIKIEPTSQCLVL
ncbi:E3 ubiquitin-protein ligase TRIM45-like [Mytilus trossulus]|uniref:E3 ubiquitin-protein ligase TRIM45-like n=1 Tax=Mytilus trossulus TaxID=6551 RepID=UPI0030070036